MTTDTVPGTVGLVATWLSSDYWLRIVAGAAEVLKERGMTPICFSLGAFEGQERRTPHRFFDLVNPECLSAAMLITTASFQNDTERFLQGLGGLPAVCVGRRVEGVPSLWVQNAAGIRLLMRHLTEDCGRRRIGFIRGTDKNVEAEARYRAWEDFCFERSLCHGAELVEQGEFTEETGEAAALRLLEKNPRNPPDALVVSNDRMAMGVLRALRMKGLSVPNDVSVVGFDDLEAERADPPLTSVRQPVFEMGRRAAEVLTALLRNESIAEEHMFAPNLIVRASSQPDHRALSEVTRTSGFGANAFLDAAYPSPDRLLPWPGTPWQTEETPAQGPSGSGDSSVNGMHDSLRHAKAREHALVTSVRNLREYTVGRLEEGLAEAKTLLDLQTLLGAHLRPLGLESLTVATVKDENGYRGEARLIADCSVQEAAPVSALGAWVPSASIVTANASRAGGSLQVAQLLSQEGDAGGFLIATGALIDCSVLSQLGAALSRATTRIGASL